MKVIYDLIQRFEIIDGVPCLISTNIQLIEGGESLISIAQDWLKENTVLKPQVKKDYVGYKFADNKRYHVILAQRSKGLQIYFVPNSFIAGEPDTLFPYANKILVRSKSEVIASLENIFK